MFSELETGFRKQVWGGSLTLVGCSLRIARCWTTSGLSSASCSCLRPFLSPVLTLQPDASSPLRVCRARLSLRAEGPRPGTPTPVGRSRLALRPSPSLALPAGYRLPAPSVTSATIEIDVREEDSESMSYLVAHAPFKCVTRSRVEMNSLCEAALDCV